MTVLPRLKLTGPDARRARALAKRACAPRYRLGELLLRPTDDPPELGVVEAIYADLAAAIEAGVVDKRWLAAQRPKPRTPAKGTWYAVVLGDGAALWGELDVRRPRDL